MVYSIQGSIQDKNGAPVSDAVIMVVEGSQPHPDVASMTNEHGGFGLSLQAGTYKVLVQKGGERQFYDLNVQGAGRSLNFRWTFPVE